MNPEDFCFWLQGYFDIHDNEFDKLTALQLKKIKEKLDEVTESIMNKRNISYTKHSIQDYIKLYPSSSEIDRPVY